MELVIHNYLVLIGLAAGLCFIVAAAIVFALSKIKNKYKDKKSKYKYARNILIIGLLLMAPSLIIKTTHMVNHVYTGTTINYASDDTLTEYFTYNGEKYVYFDGPETEESKEEIPEYNSPYYISALDYAKGFKTIANFEDKDAPAIDILSFMSAIDYDNYLFTGPDDLKFDFLFASGKDGDFFDDIYINENELDQAMDYYENDDNYSYCYGKIEYVSALEVKRERIKMDANTINELRKSEATLNTVFKEFIDKSLFDTATNRLPEKRENDPYEILNIDGDDYNYYDIYLLSDDGLMKKEPALPIYITDDKMYQVREFDLYDLKIDEVSPLIGIQLSESTSEKLRKLLT